ncbi:hypothetical protein GO755_23940 [Spirosoma sp. HMF4905]|uniref:Dystroglycan-type cadherin-like domain-containing protein n=1 Tax=Spirosoma arboris TaxID=2682092 RepID=A0A7K1SHC3_9BACT|nr:putative Ig domain-containing protein [Spirosoma arboris]MVM33114.1 hypothetical protein [Spirosoma arboris]
MRNLLLSALFVLCSLSSLAQTTWSPIPLADNMLYSVATNGSLFVAVGNNGLIRSSSDGITWTNRPVNFGGYLFSVSYGNGLFVAVGDGGTILTSPNGVTWTARSSGVSSSLRGLTFANGLFIIVGLNGTILTSPDGIAWTPRSSGSTAILKDVAYGNGLFVIVGWSGNIMTSPDGITWTSRNISSGYSLESITYGNGLFVTGGSGTTIFTSANGITWTAGLLSSNTGSISDVIYVNGSFVAVGGLSAYTSPDGITWTPRTTSNSLSGVAYANGVFVGVGNVILISPDSISWTLRSPAINGSPKDITYGNGVYVAVGNNILTSSDGLIWTSQNIGNDLNGVVYANGLFVAVGYGAIFTSPDGKTWTSRLSGTSGQLTSVTYANGLYVAVGWNGIIMTSPDGISWTNRNIDTTNYLYDIIYANSQFVAVGSGAVFTSPDGLAWTSRGIANGFDVLSIAYGNGLLIATGKDRINSTTAIYSSADGITWILRSTGTDGYLRCVIYANGTFVAVGDKGAIFASSNGTSWTRQESPTVEPLTSVAYANGSFIVVGGGILLTSTDSITWVSRGIGSSSNLNGVAYGNGMYVAVGGTGMIMTSTDGATWTGRSSGTINNLRRVSYGNGLFVAVGASSEYGVLLTSPDGINWTSRPTEAYGYGISDCTFGNGVFVAVEESGYGMVSLNGTTWYRSFYAGRRLYGVTYGNGLFVAVGDVGTIYVSSDGVNWTRKSLTNTSVTLNGVSYGNGVFTIVGYDAGSFYRGVAYTSANGTSWTAQNIGGIISNPNNLIYANSLFMTVGWSGKIITSPTGIAWTTRTSGTINTLNGVGYGNGLFVAVGDGIILTSLDDSQPNTLPKVQNAIPDQTASIGQPFNYTIPANTFTDDQTPNSLTVTLAGLPDGLQFTNNVVSGTLALGTDTSVPYSVTVTATDPGGLAISTTFLLKATICPPNASVKIMPALGSSLTVCAGSPLSLTAIPNTSVVSYVWSGSTPIISSTVGAALTYPLSGGNSYSIIVTDANGCTATASAIVSTVELQSVKNGNWNDPTVWSCGRIPIGTDAVQLLHLVTIPANFTAQVGTMVYKANGSLKFNTDSRLRILNYDSNIELFSNVKMVSDNVNQQLSTLNETQLVFQTSGEIANFKVGDILVSGIHTNAINGYLRKVTSISNSGGQTIINTQNAALNELIKNGDIKTIFDLSNPTTNSPQNTPGIISSVNLAVGITLFDADGNTGTTGDQLNFKGQFNNKLTGYINWKFTDNGTSKSTLSYFIAKYDVANETSLQLDIPSITIPVIEKTLEEYRLPPIRIPAFPFMPIRPVTSVKAGAKFTGKVSLPVQTFAKMKTNGSIGTEYVNGATNWINSWDSILDSPITGFREESASTSVEFACYLKLEVKFTLFDQNYSYVDKLFKADANAAVGCQFDAAKIKATVSTGNNFTICYSANANLYASAKLSLLNATLLDVSTTALNIPLFKEKCTTTEKPIIITQQVSSVTATSAQVQGVIQKFDLGNFDKYGMVYSSTNTSPTIDDNKVDFKTGLHPPSSKTFTAGLTNLIPGKTYYVRAYANTSFLPAYGGVLSFTTTVPPFNQLYAYGTYNLISYRQGELASGTAVISPTGWTIRLWYNADKSGSPGYLNSGSFDFVGKSTTTIIPSNEACSCAPCYSNGGYCTRLPIGWIFNSVVNGTSVSQPAFSFTEDAQTFTSIIGGQTVWQKVN